MKFARHPLFLSAPDGPAGGGAAAAGGSGDQVVVPSGGDGNQQAQPAARPEFIPETYWDSEASTLKPEAGEVFKSHQAQAERAATLAARKAEDIKIALPETVKIPEGMEFKIDEKNDPRIPVIREMALKRGWDQETVDDLIAFDAQQQIAAHQAEGSRLEAEDKKLGANSKDRKTALGSWLAGPALGLNKAEQAAMAAFTTDAESVRALEKIMGKLAGSVPGHTPNNQPKPPKPSQEQRWYGQTTPTNPQQKAS